MAKSSKGKSTNFTVKKQAEVKTPSTPKEPKTILSKTMKEFYEQCFKEDKDFHQALAIAAYDARKYWTVLEKNLRKA